MFVVRTATEADTEGIVELYLTVYGTTPGHYRQYSDSALVKKMIFADDSTVVVAVEEETGRILGTAAVLEESGAYTDLGAEFGRLAVHPEVRNRGIGRLLMEGRLARVEERLHIGIIEARLETPFSTRIARRNGFSFVGYLPGRILLERRENLALLVRHFGDALTLRRNNPRIIPEADSLAHLALENCGLPVDAIIDDESAPYPYRDDFRIERMTTAGYASLLRIERGRLENREIFGPMRLHYGFFKLKAKNSQYLLARQRERLVGAIGFTVDEVDKVLRVFELISMQDDGIRFLLRELIRYCQWHNRIHFAEVDVCAYAPRMQRTLLELGFVPIGYVPASVFHKVERRDVVKMAMLFGPFDPSRDVLIPEAEAIVGTVVETLLSREIQPRIRQAVDLASLFRGLNQEQQQRLASGCDICSFPAGETIFSKGHAADSIYLVLKGDVDILIREGERTVGRVGPGECLGEVSVLSQLPHSAHARTRGDVEAAVIQADELQSLIRMRPDIGVVLYRNLAIGLGEKLQRSDLAIADR